MDKILVIDDNLSNIQLLGFIFKKSFPTHKVFTAQSGEIGIEIARKELPNTILLDILMPKMSGFEVCNILKSDDLTKHIPVLIVSALGSSPKERTKGLNAGADAFLDKPFNSAELVAMVKVMLRINHAEHLLRKRNENMEIFIKKQTKEFNNHEDRFLQITEQDLQFFWETDSVGIFTYLSPVVKNILGFDNNKYIGEKSFVDIVCSECKQKMTVALSEVFSNYKNISNQEYLFKHKNGNKIWLTINGFPIYNEKKNFAGYRGVCRDITDTKLTKEALLESNERYFSLMNSLGTGVVLHAPDTSIILSNPMASEILGLSSEQMQGKMAIDSRWRFVRSDGADMPHEEYPVNKALSSMKSFSEYTVGVKRPDRKYITWANVNASLVFNEYKKIKYITISFNDTTKQKQAELDRLNSLEKIFLYQYKLKTLNLKLINAEENERRKIAEYLHDGIGQTLSAINIKLTYLLDYECSAEARNIIQESSNLVKDSIKETRLITYDLSPPILHELGLIQAVIWKLDQIEEKHNITTIFKSAKDFLVINNDVKLLLYRSICELLTNIIKHANAKLIEVEITKASEEIYITVTDNGKGFNNKPLDNLINQNGFGLFSINERIKSVDGSITIESEINKGTKVTLIIPIKKD